MGYQLSDLQRETLAEVFNIAMGRAAKAMSNIVNEEVLLSIPQIRMVPRSEASSLLGGPEQRVYSITQTLDGEFHADAILILPQARSMDLVRLMLGSPQQLELVTELEREALTEIGNIILNACIGTVTNLLEGQFSISLPVLQSGLCGDIIESHAARQSEEDVVLLLQIDFTVEKHSINGHLAFVQTVSSFQALLARIDRFIEKAAQG
ncbi:chemotaxis protein CheC [Andreprevotia sp. IGB-42]|uniref:chemotaxis protein CheC n=1 Tax=Andreprevotia sp. IGB-42 TaxID=2497473 RepID=UPI0013569551|nr:chemotaxis protein CheC [Andreprevotia sp. IGB-42]